MSYNPDDPSIRLMRKLSTREGFTVESFQDPGEQGQADPTKTQINGNPGCLLRSNAEAMTAAPSSMHS